MRVGAGGNFDGFGLVFTRLIGTRLDNSDNYESAWAGNTLDTEQREETNNSVIVGISGKKKENIGSLTLVTVPLDAVLPPRDADPPTVPGSAAAPSPVQTPAPPHR